MGDSHLVGLQTSRFTNEKIEKDCRNTRKQLLKASSSVSNFQTNLFRRPSWSWRKSTASSTTSRNNKSPTFKQKSAVCIYKIINLFKSMNEIKSTITRVSKLSQAKMSGCDMLSIFLLKTLKILPINLMFRLKICLQSNKNTIKLIKNWPRQQLTTKDLYIRLKVWR